MSSQPGQRGAYGDFVSTSKETEALEENRPNLGNFKCKDPTSPDIYTPVRSLFLDRISLAHFGKRSKVGLAPT